MYTYKRTDAPKKTVEVIVSIPSNDIDEEQKKAFSRLQSELTVEGFRKGKVPAAIAKKHISQEEIYKKLLNDLLPRLYEEIVKKENLRPIIAPRVDLVKAKAKEDWEIKFIIAEKPMVDLGAYKEAIKKVKADNKKKDIWVPGKNANAPSGEKATTENKEKMLNEILSALLKEVKFEISDLVLEEELNQRLSKLVDDVQKIGLTIEAYLKSKNVTIDDLKNRYKKEIEDTYKLEFVLSEIAEKEHITVEQGEIDKLFVNITDAKEKEMAKQNSYYYATILRKQKTLDFLMAL